MIEINFSFYFVLCQFFSIYLFIVLEIILVLILLTVNRNQ